MFRRLTRKRQQQLAGGRAAAHSADQRQVTGSRRQWRAAVLLLLMLFAAIYSMGSLNGLLLVDASRPQIEATPFVVIVQEPTATVDAAAQAIMQATSAVAAAQAQTETTRQALAAQIASVEATATAFSTSIEQQTHQQLAQMNIAAAQDQRVEQTKRGDVLTNALIGIVVVVLLGLIGLMLYLILTIMQPLTLTMQRSLALQAAQPAIALPPPSRTRLSHETAARVAKPTSEASDAHQPQAHHFTGSANLPQSNPAIHTLTFEWTDANDNTRRIEFSLSRELHEKLYNVADAVVHRGRKLSRRGMRGILSQAQHSELADIFQAKGFIVVTSNETKVTPLGEKFLRSVLEPLPLPDPLADL